MKKNTHLQNAKYKKDDEFYTRFDDVEKELGSYDWSDKVVYLGYEYDEIINAIDWGSWNFTKSYYNTCKKTI